MNHLSTMFSRQSTKAWAAGLGILISLYVVPYIDRWLAALTPEAVQGWFAGLGVEVPYALATALLTVVGFIVTYTAKNQPKE